MHKNRILLLIFIAIIVYIFKVECLFHRITGLYCPGCGITRTILSLFNLDIYQAFRYNSLGVILIFSSILYSIYYLINRINKKKTKKIPEWFIYILIIITILFGILRNIDLFSWLAPTMIN